MIKIYLDEDVHKKAAYALRLKGFDVLSASEINQNGLTDAEQLEYAISIKSTIFTFNVRDFIILYKEYMTQATPATQMIFLFHGCNCENL